MTSFSFKVGNLQEFARSMMAGDREVRPGHCVRCDKAVDEQTEFKDILSTKEWKITQMCQACQDFVFAPPDDEEGES